jgi:hypothetical protein
MKLKLGAIADDKPLRLTVEFPARVHRDLLGRGASARNRSVDAGSNETGRAYARSFHGDRPRLHYGAAKESKSR